MSTKAPALDLNPLTLELLPVAENNTRSSNYQNCLTIYAINTIPADSEAEKSSFRICWNGRYCVNVSRMTVIECMSTPDVKAHNFDTSIKQFREADVLFTLKEKIHLVRK